MFDKTLRRALFWKHGLDSRVRIAVFFDIACVDKEKSKYSCRFAAKAGRLLSNKHTVESPKKEAHFEGFKEDSLLDTRKNALKNWTESTVTFSQGVFVCLHYVRQCGQALPQSGSVSNKLSFRWSDPTQVTCRLQKCGKSWFKIQVLSLLSVSILLELRPRHPKLTSQALTPCLDVTASCKSKSDVACCASNFFGSTSGISRYIWHGGMACMKWEKGCSMSQHKACTSRLGLPNAWLYVCWAHLAVDGQQEQLHLMSWITEWHREHMAVAFTKIKSMPSQRQEAREHLFHVKSGVAESRLAILTIWCMFKVY